MKFMLTASLIFVLSANTNSQFLKKLNYQVEAGLGISVGPNTFGDVESEINNLTVQYFKHKRYHMPAVRIRGYAYKTINDRINLGLKTGIDVHYVEMNVYGEYETNLSVPIQAFSEIRALRINDNNCIYAGAGFGWNLKKLIQEPFIEKTGMLVSFEISINKNQRKKTFYYKAGFEYAEENAGYHFVPDHDWETEETIRYKQHRKQFYLMAGVNL